MALMEKYHALKEHANTRSHNGKKSVIMEKLAAQMVSQFPELGTLGLTHKEVASKVAAVLKDYRAMLGYEHKLSGRSMWEVPPEELQTSALKTKHLPLSQQVFELVNALEGDRDIMRPVNVHDGNIRVPYRDVEEEGQDEEEEEVEEYDEDGDAEEKQAGGAGVGEEEAVEGASGAACSGRSGAKAGVRRKPFVMSHVQKMISTIDKLGDKMTAVSKDVQAAMTLNNNNLLSVLLTIAGPQHSGGGGYQQPGGGVGGGGFQQPGGRGGFQQQGGGGGFQQQGGGGGFQQPGGGSGYQQQGGGGGFQQPGGGGGFQQQGGGGAYQQQGGGGGFQQPGGGGGSQQQGGGGGFQQPGGGGGFQQQTGGGGFPHGGYQQHGNSDGFQQGGYQQGSDPEQIGGGGLHLEESMSSGFQEFF